MGDGRGVAGGGINEAEMTPVGMVAVVKLVRMAGASLVEASTRGRLAAEVVADALVAASAVAGVRAA